MDIANISRTEIIASYVGLWHWLKVQRRLMEGQLNAPGAIARALRKQGMPFNTAYALIFETTPRAVDIVVDHNVGSGPTSIDFTI